MDFTASKMYIQTSNELNPVELFFSILAVFITKINTGTW